jgi:aminoglycoside phosphotransferase (APT) family kinase protein
VGERLVGRIQPDGHQLFLRSDTILESNVLAAVESQSSIPVPQIVAIEPSLDILGSPFFVMSHVDGRVLPDIPSCHATGWLVDSTAEKRAIMWDNGIRAMVDISHIPANPDFDFLWQSKSGHSGLEQLVTATREWFDWVSRGRDFDVIGRAMTYIEQFRPSLDDDSVNWGDARMGNLIFDANGSVAAVLDWEMASVGPPEVDLGWWLMMDEFYSYGLGAPPLSGVPDEVTQIGRWEQLMGRPAHNVEYFKILAALRFSIVSARSMDLLAEQGAMPPDTQLHLRNPVALLLYGYMGEPVPELAPEMAAVLAGYAGESS